MAVSLSPNKKLIEIDELNCPICQEMYDNGIRNPRMLTCGHTFCTDCLSTILEETEEEEPLCPDCRTEIEAEDVDSIPICYLVKKIKDTVDQLNKDILKSTSKSVTAQNLVSRFQAAVTLNDNGSKDKLPSNGICTEHYAPRHFWCNTCQKWICGTCIFLKHGSSCKVTTLTESFTAFQPEYSQKVLAQRRVLFKIHSGLNTLLKGPCGPKDMLEDVLSKQANVEEDIAMLDKALDLIDDCRTTSDKIKAIEYVKNLFDAQCYPKSMEDILKGLWKCFMNNKRFMAQMVNLTEASLVATCTVNGSKKMSVAYRFQNFVRFFCMVDIDASSPSPVYFHISDLFIPGLHTFFRIADRNHRFVGNVVFRLFEGSDRARHFRMLCSGEAGPSYQGSYFLRQQGIHCQYLSGGDYEFNNGAGGRALFDLQNDVDDHLMCDGVVCGPPVSNLKHASQFKIFHSVNGNATRLFDTARGAFAIVVEGLDIVRKVADWYATWPDWRGVYVSKCGLLFYC